MKMVRTLGQIVWEQTQDKKGFREVLLRACSDGYVEINIREYSDLKDNHEDLTIVLKNEEEVDRFVKNLRTMSYMANNEQTNDGT